MIGKIPYARSHCRPESISDMMRVWFILRRVCRSDGCCIGCFAILFRVLFLIYCKQMFSCLLQWFYIPDIYSLREYDNPNVPIKTISVRTMKTLRGRNIVYEYIKNNLSGHPRPNPLHVQVFSTFRKNKYTIILNLYTTAMLKLSPLVDNLLHIADLLISSINAQYNIRIFSSKYLSRTVGNIITFFR